MKGALVFSVLNTFYVINSFCKPIFLSSLKINVRKYTHFNVNNEQVREDSVSQNTIRLVQK